MGVKSRVQAVIDSTGVLAPIVGIFVLCAIVVHIVAPIPSEYTWWKPLKILRAVLSHPHFPTSAAIFLTLGRITWAGEGASRYILSKWKDLVVLGKRPAALARTAVPGLVGVAIDWYFLEYHTVVDRVAVFFIATRIWSLPKSPGAVTRLAGELLFVFVLFISVSYAFTVFKSCLFLVREPNDPLLVQFEAALFGGTLPHVWGSRLAAEADWFVWLCDEVYFRLFDHMAVVSFFLVGAKLARERIEYLSALAICYLVGGPAYYLIAGYGPAYHDPVHFEFLQDQWLRTPMVQKALLLRTTGIVDGTLQQLVTYEFIACMPSLHIAHELVMLWYARHSKVFTLLSIGFTGLTLIAVVVLGWHYAIDSLGGGLVALLAIGLARRFRANLLPTVFMPSDVPFSTAKETVTPGPYEEKHMK